MQIVAVPLISISSLEARFKRSEFASHRALFWITNFPHCHFKNRTFHIPFIFYANLTSPHAHTDGTPKHLSVVGNTLLNNLKATQYGGPCIGVKQRFLEKLSSHPLNVL